VVKKESVAKLLLTSVKSEVELIVTKRRNKIDA